MHVHMCEASMCVSMSVPQSSVGRVRERETHTQLVTSIAALK